MNIRFVAIVALLLVFTVYTLQIVFSDGLFGWLAPDSRWGLQVLLDLGLALAGFITLAIPDAKRRGITYWPYLLLTVSSGSIGVLAYLAHRELRAGRTSGSLAGTPA